MLRKLFHRKTQPRKIKGLVYSLEDGSLICSGEIDKNIMDQIEQNKARVVRYYEEA
jgi:hypothetical protein